MKKLIFTLVILCGFTILSNAQWSRSAPDVYLSNMFDEVGIGTSVPTSKLHIYGNNNTNNVLTVITNYTGSSNVRAIDAVSVPAIGSGLGIHATGGYKGAEGWANATTHTGQAFGVYGIATGTAGSRYGVYGDAVNTGGTNAYGVYGTASGATNNWAGYFSGDGYFSGHLGIGTNNPIAKVHINNSSGTEETGLYIVQNYSGLSTKYGIFNSTNSNGTGIRYGFYNDTDGNASDNSFVYGIYTNTTSNGSGANVYGMYSYVSSLGTGNHYAVYGSNSNTAANNWAGYFNGRGYFSGDVGIGKSTPISKLDILGNNNTSNVLTVNANYSGNSQIRAVDATSAPAPGYGIGVYGTGGNSGVRGWASATTSTGAAHGVYGVATGTAGSRYGVYGFANNIGGANAIGVYGIASGATNNWAGYFDGRGYFSDELGIGTSQPVFNLDIRGSGIDDGAIMQVSNSDASHFIRMFSGRQNDANPFIQWKDGDPLRFATDAGGFSEKLRIQSTGNVGVGTTTPTVKLHIAATDNSGDIQLDDTFPFIFINTTNGNNAGFVMQNANVDKFEAYYSSSADAFIMNLVSHIGTELTFASNGNIGIGTFTPTQKLDVLGKARIRDLALDNTINNVIVSTSDGTLAYRDISTIGEGEWITSGNDIYNTNTDRVAIGTSTPATGYKFSVNGSIICEELQILPKTSWPDYVFDKNYDLWSLDDLEKYIALNKHLPGVPDAKCVEEAGISVGEMSKVMMEKIEELTLHVIEQSKQNAEQSKQLIEQSKQIKDLHKANVELHNKLNQ